MVNRPGRAIQRQVLDPSRASHGSARPRPRGCAADAPMKRPPGRPDGLLQDGVSARNYIPVVLPVPAPVLPVPVVLVVVVVVVVVAAFVSAGAPRLASVVVLVASTAVTSPAFISASSVDTFIVLLVVASLLPPQAATSRAAPATIEPVITFARRSRI